MDHNIEFFAAHPANPWLLLVALALFPRITLLFIGGPFAWFHWLGWVFTPHLLVALMATFRYADTNPGLTVVAWLLALSGTGAEARTTRKVVVR